MNTFTKRLLSAIVYVFLIFLGTHYAGYELIQSIFPTLDAKYIFIGFLVIFGAFCIYEAVQMMKFDSILFKIIAFVVCALPFYIFGTDLLYNNVSFLFSWRKLLYIVPFVIALLTIFRFDEELHSIDTSKLIFVGCYIGIPFGLALTLQNFNSLFPSEIFFIFLLIWISDTGAYLVGSKFGKTPLAPSISPKKSLEGLIGGIIFVAIAGYLIQNYFGYLQGNWIIIALIIAIFAPLGDLAASKLKRSFDVKDSSNLIPGHGGFLDRLDSFIGCIPFIYLYFLMA